MTSSSARTEAAAALLCDLHRRRQRIAALPADVRPRDTAEAYAVQQVLAVKLGGGVRGWKVGATTAEVQSKLGITEPFAGPVLEGLVHTSPAALPASDFLHLSIECELAFRLGRALKPGDAIDRAALLDAVDAVVPAIEIIAPVFDTILGDDVPSRIADLGMNGALVCGGPVTDWRRFDLVATGVALDVDGLAVAQGTGAKVLGDPVVALEWLVRHALDHGHTLAAGQVVSTGTMTGLTALEPGQTATARFADLGEVVVRFV